MSFESDSGPGDEWDQMINVTSVAGHSVGPGSAVYSGNRFAVRAISEGLREEVNPYGIRTTILSPEAVDTELPSSAKPRLTSRGVFTARKNEPTDTRRKAIPTTPECGRE